MIFRFKYMSVTLCQQGGIGWPPIIIKFDKWYSISDSRFKRFPKRIYDYLVEDKYHSQYFGFKRIDKEPSITMDEAIEAICIFNDDIKFEDILTEREGDK